MKFDLANKIRILTPHADNDELYGPYDSLELACTALPIGIREKGRTVAINTQDGVVEYWFKNGVTDIDLVVKSTGSGTAGPEILTEEFIVTSAAGSYQAGETFPAGLNFFEAIKSILTETFYPTFVAPTFSMSNNAGTREAGDTISLIITGTFNRGLIKGLNVNNAWDANATQNPRSGLPTSYVLDGTTNNVATLTSTKTITDFSIPLGSQSFSGSVNYDIGIQPKDSSGTNYMTPLVAGSLSNTTSVTGYLRRFSGPVETKPTTGAEVRSLLLSSSVINTTNSFSFTTGTTQKIFVIGLPSAKNLVSAINAGTNENLTSGFVLSEITNVPDAGGTDRPYKVYIMENAVAFSSDYRINVTLS